MVFRRRARFVRTGGLKSRITHSLRPLQKKEVTKLIKSHEAKTIEKKYVYNSFNVNATNASNPFAVLLPSIGTGPNNRIGDDIRSCDFWMRYSIVVPQGVIVSDETNYVRCIVFQWKQQTVPALGDVLETIGSFFAYAPYRQDNLMNMKILYDKAHVLTADISAGVSNSNTIVKGQVNISQNELLKSTTFNSTTSATNLLYILFVSDSSTTPHPNPVGGYMYRYCDA